MGEQPLRPSPAGLQSPPAEGQALVVGVRPEHLELDAAGPISLTVAAVEWLGHECLVSGSIGGSPAILRLAGMVSYEIGSAFTVLAAGRPGPRSTSA